MRRFGVVVALGLVVFGAIKGVGELTGGEEASGQEPAATQPGGAAGTGDGAAVAVASATPTTATTPPTPPPTEPEETGPPSEDNPAEVLIVGDSDAGTFAPYLERLLDETGLVDVELDYVVSSGLARPDFHDWPAHLRDTLATSDPDIVIVTFGGNDAQALTEPCPNGSGSCGPSAVVGQATADNADEWTTEYANRVSTMMDLILEDDERRVIWVGIPNAQDPAFTARLEIQDQAVRQALRRLPERRVRRHLGDLRRAQRRHRRTRRRPPRRRAKPVRQSDGFHLNTDGAEILAIDIAAQVEAILDGPRRRPLTQPSLCVACSREVLHAHTTRR